VLEALEELKPDLLILDVMLPGVNGFDIARMLRTTQMWQDLPIVFLTGRTDLESRVAAFESGADDYLAKPIVYEELLAHVRMRLERRRLLREMTEKDPLTKLLSRRTLLELLASRLSEARRHGRSLSLALLDVDHFKRVNDLHGHGVGDHVLAALGRLLNERFRLEDLRGRWGGEEFLIVFPGETAETAAGVLTRVLSEFQRIPFQGERGEVFHVSFSAGVSSFPDDGEEIQTLLRAADQRLYAAKDAGRAAVFAPKSPDEGARQRKGRRAIRHGAHSR
jgi:diguanylate cyclase (GGDEF)-like protein